jgi:hypothetical protein
MKSTNDCNVQIILGDWQFSLTTDDNLQKYVKNYSIDINLSNDKLDILLNENIQKECLDKLPNIQTFHFINLAKDAIYQRKGVYSWENKGIKYEILITDWNVASLDRKIELDSDLKGSVVINYPAYFHVLSLGRVGHYEYYFKFYCEFTYLSIIYLEMGRFRLIPIEFRRCLRIGYLGMVLIC